ncbi:MAG: twin-arginine translocase TatA/TatE family subunit [Actinomycetota bacterium]|nr:twin-arginine translocase TatA/TatE family subunit [Actinomycetota bacterium]
MPTSLGPAEILVILVVALIVLGPSKLPDAARQVGKTIAEVRKWSQGFQDEIRNVMDPGDAAPSYPPPVGAAPETPPPADQLPPGPATPADAEYTGPLPETPPSSGIDPSAPGTGTAGHASTNGSLSDPAAPEPSEPPAGEPPAS